MTRRAPALAPGTVLFFALLAATLAVAVLVVRSRSPDLVLEVREISPRALVLDDEGEATSITLFVREGDERAEVEIVDRDGVTVRTLAAPVALEPGRLVTYRWDGRTDDDKRARSGRYRIRVELPERGREMIWPQRIVVDRPPRDRDGEGP